MGVQKRVLVVDDDASIRELLSTALEDDGYEVVPARNGEDALSVCERWRPDVIVLDLMMPVMDGWTFAKRLHETDDIPIVVLSAANDLERHAKVRSARRMSSGSRSTSISSSRKSHARRRPSSPS